MKKSSALKILRTFSQKEMEEFRDFLISPYYNKKSTVVKLLDVIRKKGPDFTDESLEKETIWKKIYPDKPYNYGVMKNLIHEITRLAEKYISIKSYETTTSYERNLIRSLFDRNITDLFEAKLEKFKRLIKNYNYDELPYQADEVFYYFMKLDYQGGTISVIEYLKDDMEAKKNYALLLFFQSFSHLHNQVYLRDIQLNLGDEIKFFKFILNHYEENPPDESIPVVIRLYIAIFQALTDLNNESKYQRFKELFDENKKGLHRIDLLSLLNLLVGYFEAVSHIGILKYEAEHLDLRIELAENNLMRVSESADLSLYHYRNIVIMCRRNNAPDKMEKFIGKSIDKVSKTQREAIYNYSMASLNFLRKNYEAAIEYGNLTIFNELNSKHSDNIFFKNDLKRINIECLYELGYYEEVFMQIDSYKHFLKNTKLLPEILRNSRSQYLKILNELTKLNLDYNEYLLKSLKDRVKNSRELWLLNKIEELEEKNKKSIMDIKPN